MQQPCSQSQTIHAQLTPSSSQKLCWLERSKTRRTFCSALGGALPTADASPCSATIGCTAGEMAGTVVFCASGVSTRKRLCISVAPSALTLSQALMEGCRPTGLHSGSWLMINHDSKGHNAICCNLVPKS